jgi:hypothetical protein
MSQRRFGTNCGLKWLDAVSGIAQRNCNHHFQNFQKTPTFIVQHPDVTKVTVELQHVNRIKHLHVKDNFKSKRSEGSTDLTLIEVWPTVGRVSLAKVIKAETS